jgi:hypothetical protein
MHWRCVGGTSVPRSKANASLEPAHFQSLKRVRLEINRYTSGTPAARELHARPRRFERPTFAAGAFTHIPSEQNRGRCRSQTFRLLRTYARP